MTSAIDVILRVSDITECLITEHSTVSDFLLTDDELQQISHELGFTVHNEDNLFELNQRYDVRNPLS